MLNYTYKKGKKITVLFLHGWGGNKDSFCYVADFLNSYGYGVLCVDLSGFGESKMTKSEYHLEDYYNDVKELLDFLNIHYFYIVAHSFGARVAVLFDNVPKMVLTGAAGLKSKKSLAKFLKINIYKFKKLLVNKGVLDSKKLAKYGSDDYKALPLDQRRTFINIVNRHLEDEYKKINSDTLLYFGENDTATPLYMAKKMHKLIKNSKLIIAKGTHFAYLENSFEFSSYALNFFEGDKNRNV